MKILMFGWEFPPQISGGLGVACFGITKALTELDNEIIFVIPRSGNNNDPTHVTILSASTIPLSDKYLAEERIPLKGLDFKIVPSPLRPYLNEAQYFDSLHDKDSYHFQRLYEEKGEKKYHLLEMSGQYGPNLSEEVIRYGKVAGQIAEGQTFDIIHAHDWMTVFAGIHAKKISGKPLVLHIHALEFDRSGENVNKVIYDIEKLGMISADHIIAVSNYTKGIITERYGISPDKISVVHNAVFRKEWSERRRLKNISDRKIVLFLGRVTFQKGPDYFVEAAAKVLKELPNVIFVIAGAGDMMLRMIHRVAELRIGRNFHFTGFLKPSEVEDIFKMSDLYVMPSVSEPFGISPLEAMAYDVPVIISKQSGVSEILNHVLKVNFWDVQEIANKIIAILKRPTLLKGLVDKSREALQDISWKNSAEKIMRVYHSLNF